MRLSAALVVILLHCRSTTSGPSKRLFGTFGDQRNRDFDVDFWTFTANADSVINGTGFTIASERGECVKAVAINDLKGVEFLPERVYKKFSNLVIFEAENCSVKAVNRENFRELPKLVKLSLRGNNLTIIKSSSFNDLARLKSLNLAHNKIENIDQNSFRNLSTLRALELSHNRIVTLAVGTFDSLVDLRNISLDHNRITFLGDRHFLHTQRIEYIWLARNDIKHLGFTMFNDMPNLKFVDFSFNRMISEFVYDRDSGIEHKD